MKKLVITSAVLACAASIATAQTTVTSANIVGYNKDISNPGLHISGYQFIGTGTTPSEVFGDQLPIGTKIYAYNGSGYDVSEYQSYFDFEIFEQVTNWNPNTVNLDNGKGFWVRNFTPNVETSILSGEVLMDQSVTNVIDVGLQILSYPYPIQLSVDEMEFNPSIGDKIYAYNGAGYDVSEYQSYFDFEIFEQVTNWNPIITLDVGEGFWYRTTVSTNWIVNKPF